MRNLKIKNIKRHHSQSLAKANASKDLQINFNQAEDVLTIPAESKHNHKCGFATQSGRSMIEMLGVLAIIGVLSVGGIAGYSKAMTKYRINKTIEQITLIAGNIRSFFASQKNYEGLSSEYTSTSDIIKKAKLIPDEMIEYFTSDTEVGKIKRVNNPFGGTLSVNAWNKAKGGDDQAFCMKIIEVPEDACIEIMSYDWSLTGKVVLMAARKTFQAPLSVEQAITYCSLELDEETGLTNINFFFDADWEYWKNDKYE